MRKTINGKRRYIKCRTIKDPKGDQLDEFIAALLNTTHELYHIFPHPYHDDSDSYQHFEYYVYYYRKDNNQ